MIDLYYFVMTVFMSGIVGLMWAYSRRMAYSFMGFMAVIVMFWGNDVLSRQDRVNFFAESFANAETIICHDDHSNSILIAPEHGWQIKGAYGFKGDKGIDLLYNLCEVQGKSTPSFIPMEILIAITVLISMWIIFFFFQELNRTNQKEIQE